VESESETHARCIFVTCVQADVEALSLSHSL
jgi:hypothetical protein